MREIKFRAWDKNKKVFIPTDVWAVCQTDFGAFGVMLKDWEDYREGEYFYDMSQELQQFTGFYDKNRKEIYEGDILVPMSEHLAPYKVVFLNGCFMVENKNGIWGTLDRAFEISYEFDHYPEIIGNIYENS